VIVLFFFFQAEDGIRDFHVTGVQTCALPILRPDRRQALAMRWLSSYSRARGEKTMVERLAAELMEASQGRGNAVKKRDDTHKMRSEERRVGKEWRAGGAPDLEKERSRRREDG